jgi:hypothetical protein
MKAKKMVTGALLVLCGAVVVPGLAMAAIDSSNSCHDCESTSGDATTANSSATFVGQNGIVNLQDGDNSAHSGQDASALTGDANSGQVVGQAGDGSYDPNRGSDIDAANSCTDCESGTGDATSVNSSSTFVGQNGGVNVQDGDNSAHQDQSSNAQSGDSNSGQVIGQVNG